MNKYTSKNTSVNSKRIPRGFSLLYPYGKILDYGCGKYWKISQKYCEERGAKYFKYDPYNVPEDENINIDKNKGEFDTIYCNNVLNVISDAYEILEVIEDIVNLLKENGLAIFTIYEGDRSEVGRETKKDCYQRNMKTKSYSWFFEYAETKNCVVAITSECIKMKKLDRKTALEFKELLNDELEKPF